MSNEFEFDEETDACLAQDRAFFEKNPGRRLYVRKPAILNGVEAAYGNAVAIVLVTPDVRLRAPLVVPAPVSRNIRAINDDEEGALDALFQVYPGIRKALDTVKRMMH